MSCRPSPPSTLVAPTSLPAALAASAARWSRGALVSWLLYEQNVPAASIVLLSRRLAATSVSTAALATTSHPSETHHTTITATTTVSLS